LYKINFMKSENHTLMEIRERKKSLFERFATYVTIKTGSTGAFIIAVTIIVIWLITGPIFDYSDTWQLVINTGTTIITFLMVFLIQKSQNRDSIAMQIKLNELVAVSEKASNRLIDVEDLSEEDLQTLENYFRLLAEKAKHHRDVHSSHSIEEAGKMHDKKYPDSERK
jgi:low affinity Fe/Cu permease